MTNRTALIALTMLAGCEVTPLYIGFLQVDGGTSSSSTSTTGGAGGALLCAPGTTQSCYDGPPGTEGQGICKAGAQTCAADGASWGPCTGAVLPQPEDCATPEDEDCDGKAPPCKGILMWAKQFGDASDQHANAIASDASGNVLITGDFSGTVDFGGGPLASVGGQDIFVAKLDPTGAHVWSRRFGDVASGQVGQSIAVDAAGNVLITGRFSGAVDFGGGPLQAAGQDVFVAKLGTDGSHVWSKRFGDTGSQFGQSLAVDTLGNVLVAGYFGGAVDFGSGPLTSVGGYDAFVVKLGADGAHVWSKSFGGAGNDVGASVATDASDNVLMTGTFSNTVDFGGGPQQSAGGQDIFVAKLDPTGAHLWSKRFGDGSDQTSVSIASDSTGSALLAGHMAGAADFGGGPQQSAGGQDIFVAKLDPTSAHLWSKRFGDPVDQFGQGIAADVSGSALVTGYFFGTVDFGTGPMVSKGGADIFVAKFGP